MKILQLTAENVKKIKVVDITPKGDVIQITGRNGQGKTSVLDSIWWALGGKSDVQSVPIRRGAESGRIRLDLGSMIVERKFLPSGTTTLTVRNAVGAAPGTPDKKLPAYGSPQEMLDDLIGRLSFDPLAFARKKAFEQYEELKAVAKIEVDIAELESANEVDFKKRGEVNKEAKAKKAQLAALTIPNDLPESAIDEQAILNAMQAAAEHNTLIETRKVRREQAGRDVTLKREETARLQDHVSDLEQECLRRVEELEAQIVTVKNDYGAKVVNARKLAAAALATAEDLERRIAAAEPLPAPVSVAELRTSLDDAKAKNAMIARRKQRDSMLAEVQKLEAAAQSLTEGMADREQTKRKAIENAEMPLPGLSLSAGQVIYEGLPFDQASDAEQLRVSVSIAMPANAKLRVLRIRDGSLLDEDGIGMIQDMAREKDYQIWIEVVDKSGEIGVVMEDGEVIADHQTAEATNE